MQVIIYSTTTCPYCKMLKDYCVSKNLQFEEKLVDTDPKIEEEMMAVSGGFMGVPFSLIVKDDGTKETIIGFDKGKLDNILGGTQ